MIRLAVREHILKDAGRYYADAGAALLFANLLATLRFDATAGFRFARADLHATLASFSYTLYVFHVPVVFWLAGLVAAFWGAGWRLEPAGALHYGLAITMVCAILGVGYGLSLLTEAHTERVRRMARRFWARGDRVFAGRSPSSDCAVRRRPG